MNEQIIFIRHSQSQPTPDLPPSRWPLTALGRQRCAALAERLRAHAPDVIVCSAEQKTLETGALVAGQLGLPHASAPDLHEHMRERVAWLSGDEFERGVAAMFAHPDQLVFGEETANAAYERFAGGVHAALAAHPGQRLAIVTHGTVLALFVARHAGIAAPPFWRSLGMPAIVVMRLPDFGLLEVVPRVE